MRKPGCIAVQKYCGDKYYDYRSSLKLLKLQILELGGKEGEFSINEMLSWVTLYNAEDCFLNECYYEALCDEASLYFKRNFLLKIEHLGETYFQWNTQCPVQTKEDGSIDLYYEFRRNYYVLKSQCEHFLLQSPDRSVVNVKNIFHQIRVAHKEDLGMAKRYRGYIRSLLVKLSKSGYFQIIYRSEKSRHKLFVRTSRQFCEVQYQSDFFVPLKQLNYEKILSF